jgi:hypothetical protein
LPASPTARGGYDAGTTQVFGEPGYGIRAADQSVKGDLAVKF